MLLDYHHCPFHFCFDKWRYVCVCVCSFFVCFVLLLLLLFIIPTIICLYTTLPMAILVFLFFCFSNICSFICISLHSRCTHKVCCKVILPYFCFSLSLSVFFSCSLHSVILLITFFETKLYRLPCKIFPMADRIGLLVAFMKWKCLKTHLLTT